MRKNTRLFSVALLPAVAGVSLTWIHQRHSISLGIYT